MNREIINISALGDSVLSAYMKDEFVMKRDLKETVDLYYVLTKKLLARNNLESALRRAFDKTKAN